MELYDTYPLQSEVDPLIGGTVELEESVKLSDVSILTKPPSEAGELADCYIVDPPETLPEEIFDISELLETPDPVCTPERYVQLYMVVVDPTVANEQAEKVVTNPFDTGLHEVNQLARLRKEVFKEKKHDLEGEKVARHLVDINGNWRKVVEQVNKKIQKRKRKDENDLEVEKTCKDTPKKKKQKKATTKDAVKTAPSAALGAAPSTTPPLPSSIPPPVDRSREPERCVSPLIGLTHGSWPKQRREILICVLYTQNVFFLLSLSKASIVQYMDLPYEKRLNLTPTSFHRLVHVTAALLKYYYNVEQDCAMGKPIIPPLMITVSEDHNLHAVVTSYRGKGKIHLGTRAYCDILMTKVEGGGYTLSPPKDRGCCIPLLFFQEIDDMFGRVETAWESMKI